MRGRIGGSWGKEGKEGMAAGGEGRYISRAKNILRQRFLGPAVVSQCMPRARSPRPKPCRVRLEMSMSDYASKRMPREPTI